jgi:hypothetical protein
MNGRICKSSIHAKFFSGQDCLRPIALEEFSKHVQRMHADRDKLFELEYNVSGMHYNLEVYYINTHKSQRILTVMKW